MFTFKLSVTFWQLSSTAHWVQRLKSDGSIDVYTDMWMPSQQAIWAKYIDEANSVATNQPYVGT